MLIRNTPKNPEKYKKIRNEKMIYELAIIGIQPKYADSDYCYYVISEKLLKYLKDKEFEQWLN